MGETHVEIPEETIEKKLGKFLKKIHKELRKKSREGLWKQYMEEIPGKTLVEILGMTLAELERNPWKKFQNITQEESRKKLERNFHDSI